MQLSGATVLLTGASGGLGHAIARALAERHASLVLTARRAAVIDALAAETGGRAIACDLADPSGVDALLAEIGEIDVLVANAGLPATGPMLDYSLVEIDRIFGVNLLAPTRIAHGLLPAMVRKGKGHIVFISSLSGKAATVGSSLYSATKFGLRGLALGMRADYAGAGVGVSAIFPGPVRDAGMFADAHIDLPRAVGTSSPAEVGAAVVRAIERNRAEIDVAAFAVRAGALFSSVAPELAIRAARLSGAERIAGLLAEGQRDKMS